MFIVQRKLGNGFWADMFGHPRQSIAVDTYHRMKGDRDMGLTGPAWTYRLIIRLEHVVDTE